VHQQATRGKKPRTSSWRRNIAEGEAMGPALKHKNLTDRGLEKDPRLEEGGGRANG